MDQSKSSSKQSGQCSGAHQSACSGAHQGANSGAHQACQIDLPPRKFTTEFWVGLFALISVGMSGWLAVGLGGLALLGDGRYEIFAEFDNISGLQRGASVEIGGVQVGEVQDLSLKDPKALVRLRIDDAVKIRDDDIFSIRTKGIIGDRYVKISRGGSSILVNPGETTSETESVVDIEDIIGKIVHSMTGEKDDKEKSSDKNAAEGAKDK